MEQGTRNMVWYDMQNIYSYIVFLIYNLRAYESAGIGNEINFFNKRLLKKINGRSCKTY